MYEPLLFFFFFCFVFVFCFFSPLLKRQKQTKCDSAGLKTSTLNRYFFFTFLLPQTAVIVRKNF